MRDVIFGFSGSAILALTIPLLTPFSPYWSAGMIAAGYFSVLALGNLAYRWISSLRQKSVIQPNIPIHDAIDYIVNDLTAKLKQPAPPRIAEFGPR